MLQVILKRVNNFYESGNRWWLPLLCGLLYALPYPPFNAMLHPVFAPMPLFAPLSLVALFFFATRPRRRRAIIHSYIFCAAMIFGQSYWIGFVTAEGYWILVMIGVALISIVWGGYYLLAALALRLLSQRLPRLYIAVFPAVWVLIEYFRTLTDLAFPWALTGYGAVGILPLAQLSSFTGVWGLSYLILFGNAVIWDILRAVRNGEVSQSKLTPFYGWAAFTFGIIVWGIFRMNAEPMEDNANTARDSVRIALMQSYMDQFNWGIGSLDTAVTVSDSMVRIAAAEKPDALIFPESGLLCYLERRPDMREVVARWNRTAGVPVVLGALHWDFAYIAGEYDVYNSAFMVKDSALTRYDKIMLVPFSEIMPFQARFPILSRINLGNAGFRRGANESIFSLTDKLSGAPYICYEITFPNFVRRRLTGAANMIINITNDGWFGRTSGPYQHAAMSQMRSIENGIAQARAANSGISMFVDQYGRVIAKTGLYTREILVRDVPVYRVMTFYNRYGDWFVAGCLALTIIGIALCFINNKRLGEITNPLLIDEQKFVPINQ